jgi:hypothetical protein
MKIKKKVIIKALDPSPILKVVKEVKVKPGYFDRVVQALKAEKGLVGKDLKDKAIQIYISAIMDLPLAQIKKGFMWKEDDGKLVVYKRA